MRVGCFFLMALFSLNGAAVDIFSIAKEGLPPHILSGSKIFTFSTPSTVSNNYMELSFQITDGKPGSCSTSTVVAVPRGCNDSSHAGKNYYIDQTLLYTYLTNLSGESFAGFSTVTGANCIKGTDGYSHSNASSALTLDCASLANNCSSPSSYAFGQLVDGGTTCTPITLGTSSNFVVLAQSSISGAPTSVTGDVGLGSVSGTNITGITCGEVTGTIYTIDGTGPSCAVSASARLTTAQSDFNSASTSITGQGSATTISNSGDLAGQTLTPGLYDSGANTIVISGGGTLTLDAQYDANAVFLIRSTSTIITSTSSSVVLINGAQAKNIYWTAASSVTLGSSSTMKGTMIAAGSITIGTSAALVGRAIAGAAVTLNSSCTVASP